MEGKHIVILFIAFLTFIAVLMFQQTKLDIEKEKTRQIELQIELQK
jgi:hypothetical protein